MELELKLTAPKKKKNVGNLTAVLTACTQSVYEMHNRALTIVLRFQFPFFQLIQT